MKQPWINNAKTDLLFILSPPFLVLATVFLFQDTLMELNEKYSFFTWLFLIVFVDVAHVYSTLFKTYFVKQEFEKRKKLYLTIPILSLVLGIILQLKLSKLRVFNFEYESVFPLKFLIAPENANFPIKTFVHSKVFIIDDEVMYWGSMNFTSMGTQDNYETRIRTTDEITISKMSQEFASLMNSNKLPERKLSIWGHQIYHGQNQDD